MCWSTMEIKRRVSIEYSVFIDHAIALNVRAVAQKNCVNDASHIRAMTHPIEEHTKYWIYHNCAATRSVNKQNSLERSK